MTSVALPAATTTVRDAVRVRWSATALSAMVAVFLVVGWTGIRSLNPILGWDGDAFKELR